MPDTGADAKRYLVDPNALGQIVQGMYAMSDYLADVKRYDGGASEEHVKKIVRHLGIALQSRDASLVSCTDPSELDRVVEKWCMKKLGASDKGSCDAVVEKVCEEMKDDRNKSRVTFYYLVAKHMGQLGTL